MAQPFDPYRALGIRREATEAEVKAAHRKLAKRFHPDKATGDSERFLKVQEAYRVLSDPLQRREWDAKHAPGPVRGGAPAGPAPTRARAPRRPQRPQKPVDAEQSTPPPSDEPPSRRPRSSRAYTWSAAEVPWWEEGVSGNKRQPGRRRPAAGKQTTPPPSEAEPAGEAANPFDVYNRSSGAAWSMAARAYFRRGDQDLPRRGSWQYEGTQVLTGARARTYAEAQARRRAAAPRPEPAPQPAAAAGPTHAAGAAAGATGSAAHGSTFTYTTATMGVAHDANTIHEARRSWQRRTNAASWPSLKERLIYALVAWIPLAILIGYGGAAASGCDVASSSCPSMVETTQAVAIALVLGLLVALPKVAYVGAMAAIGGLLIGLVIVAVFSLTGVTIPLSVEMTALLAAALAAAYIGSAAFVLLRHPSHRPWYTGAQP